MALSNYFENKLIDFIFRGQSYVPPDTFYIALCTDVITADLDGSNIPEITGGNYSRKPISTGNTTWFSTQADTASISTGTSGSTGNVNIIRWNSVTWSGSLATVAICDAPSGGNLFFFTAISTIDVGIGASVVFSSNDLNFNFVSDGFLLRR